MFVIGGVLFSIFSRLAFPYITNIGLLIIGAGIVLIGIRPIIEVIHSMAFTTDHPASKGSRTLLPPVLHGSMIVLIGCALMLYALVVISGWAGRAAAYFGHRPGMLLVFLGVLGEMYALYLFLRRQDV